VVGVDDGGEPGAFEGEDEGTRGASGAVAGASAAAERYVELGVTHAPMVRSRLAGGSARYSAEAACRNARGRR
jgi:hypothetical protein